MEGYSKLSKYVSVLEYNNHSVRLGYAQSIPELLVLLLICLEGNAEGACGYIADVETGKILQRHQKVSSN